METSYIQHRIRIGTFNNMTNRAVGINSGTKKTMGLKSETKNNFSRNTFKCFLIVLYLVCYSYVMVNITQTLTSASTFSQQPPRLATLKDIELLTSQGVVEPGSVHKLPRSGPPVTSH